MLLLGGHYHCVKVSSDSEMVRGMGLWEFSGALRELMLRTLTLLNKMSLLARYPVLGFSVKVRFNPACSATETSYKIQISLVACFNKQIKYPD